MSVCFRCWPSDVISVSFFYIYFDVDNFKGIYVACIFIRLLRLLFTLLPSKIMITANYCLVGMSAYKDDAARATSSTVL